MVKAFYTFLMDMISAGVGILAQPAQIGYENGVNKIFHEGISCTCTLSIPIPVSVLCAHLIHVVEQSPGRCEISVCMYT